MKKWQKYLQKAIEHKINSETYLTKAVQELMRTKGFSENQVNLFDASFASGFETIITFNSDGEFNDRGLENYALLTKEDIIKILSKHLMPHNVDLLTKSE